MAGHELCSSSKTAKNASSLAVGIKIGGSCSNSIEVADGQDERLKALGKACVQRGRHYMRHENKALKTSLRKTDPQIAEQKRQHHKHHSK